MLFQANKQIEAVLSNIASTSVTSQGSPSVTAKISNKSLVISGSPSGTTFIKAGSTSFIIADKVTARRILEPQSRHKGIPLRCCHQKSHPSSYQDLTSSAMQPSPDPSSLSTATLTRSPLSKFSLLLSSQVSHGTARLSLPAYFAQLEDAGVELYGFIARGSLDSMIPSGGKVDEYEFHQGNTLYRGYFKGINATGVNLAIQGAWINSKFLFSNNGTNQYSSNGGTNIVNDTLTFLAGSLTSGDNILTVILDPTGLEEDFDGQDKFKTPRGIRGYNLLGGVDFDTWRIIGNFGGESGPDTVCGNLNEGGLFVERTGAHLVGYSTQDNSWATGASCNPLTRTGLSAAGIKAFRTSFNLNFPAGSDIPVALNITRMSSSRHRSVIYVNGWQLGRFSSADGPQTLFPLSDGILNSSGNNNILITLWSLGAKFRDIELVSTALLQSSKTPISGGLVASPSLQQLR
ncbi:hypothetical protein M422DRAFT_258182 [Sphaerobolus stellatus SS14]|uniref:Beta-galactosidase jelly roll domain-containing protein n=1 Tax=Sphaerobolus stellatus (strain SS14) TaxID=990650 RepID=A0A0C9U7R0_SPHS4|nr:hypothetical protein M422DRAFT_258182 [Sphaerobolus stellatus SS14]